ncbi:MAG: MBL fold metallo-hydrolase [Rhodospirillaceae bacterium]|mgnify:CR=1 FL=1|nr:MBL fold metallo-hydrolase [Rhodospirillaceae bacterium]|tara:strand:- start:214 stop:1074 length:861 start_codon:yes stop_codon:yes gene_type:complete
MRTCISTIFLATLFVFSNALSQDDRDWDAVVLTIHHVAGGVYYLEGSGGNIGLSVGEDGIVMIDDQFAPLTDRIVARIAELDDGEIRFVINTHRHGDHMGGNENLANMGITILANDRVRVRLLADMLPDAALPILTYSDTATVHLNGEEVHVFTVPPAHTDGDSFVHFRASDVLHLGDVFRTNNFPYIDLSNGGTLQGTLDALAIAIGMSGPNTLIIPGHGAVSAREDVIDFRDMALVVAQRVEALVREGATFQEVLAAETTAEYEDKWGDPERFLRGVYAEVGGQ